MEDRSFITNNWLRELMMNDTTSSTSKNVLGNNSICSLTAKRAEVRGNRLSAAISADADLSRFDGRRRRIGGGGGGFEGAYAVRSRRRRDKTDP